MVATASAGTAAVRKKDPAHYPAAPHAYYRLGDHELHAPLLCAACFERVEPNNLFQVCALACVPPVTALLSPKPADLTKNLQTAWPQVVTLGLRNWLTLLVLGCLVCVLLFCSVDPAVKFAG